MPRAKNKTTKETETFACRRCGVCCTKHQALVTPEDIARISAYLGIAANDWEKLYDDSRWRFPEHRLIRHINGVCAFLKFNEGLATCKIHSVKPDCCSQWQAGLDKTECREGMGEEV